MDIEEIRKVVLATVASIAPDSDGRPIRPDLPLRQQVDLDSMDWLNVLVGLQDRLQVDIRESDFGPLATLDSIAADLASRRTTHPADPLHQQPDPFEELPRTSKLVDGSTVTLRPVRAEDAPLEADFVCRLSAQSRYKRFMATMRELPPDKLRYLTAIDSVHHVAVAATVDREGQEAFIGVARYAVDGAGAGCEFAIAVGDEWQGSGVAGILMHTLMDIARSRGLKRMEGIVLATNSKMLKFMRQLGFGLHSDPEDRHNVLVARTL